MTERSNADPDDRRVRVRRALLLAVSAATWAFIVFLTGGIDVHIGSIHITSENYRRPAWLAVAIVAVGWWLGHAGERWRTLSDEWQRLTSRVSEGLASTGRTGAIAVAAIAAVGVTTVALDRGALVAGGADSYGYVSQAHLWATGNLKIDEPLTHTLDWPFVLDALSPLGYTGVADQRVLVPTYAPGYPMVMAVFERLMGPRAAFWVVPILGGLAVFAVYLMGAHLAGHGTGAAAAVLLATSPIFLGQVMVPMSDVPVAAWWAICLALLPFPPRIAALAAGGAAAMAILTRPNLVPLVLVPAGYLLWEVSRERSITGKAAQRMFGFGIPAAAAFVTVAALNNYWYGSPWKSGYGTLSGIYHLEYFWPNLLRYPAWLVHSETPVVLIALAAPFVTWRMRATEGTQRLALISAYVALAVVTWACYVLYIPFDAWVYLRFLMPAIPIIAVLIAASLTRFVDRLFPTSAALTLVILVVALAGTRVAFARDNAIFNRIGGERQYQVIGEYAGSRLPANAILLAMQNSGSARYYSGRTTVRYDQIPGPQLDRAIADLRRLGYHPYILVYDWEHEQFLERFKGHSRLATLDWPAVVMMKKPSMLRIYDPADVDGSSPPQKRETEVIP